MTQESALSYPDVGATRDDVTPAGYHALRARRRIGDAGVLDRAGDVVLAFGMQRGAGITVTATEPLARTGLDLHLVVKVWPLRLRAPARVVYVVSEPDRRGFAYGTLTGHPESGEELFLVERVGEDTFAEVRAFSRPGRWFVRLGGPVTRMLQRSFARRYLDALERELTPAGEQGS